MAASMDALSLGTPVLSRLIGVARPVNHLSIGLAGRLDIRYSLTSRMSC